VRLEWRPRALADLQALRAYIAREQPAAARRVARRILAAAELLLVYPELGRAGRVLGTRELAVAHTPYLLIYRHQGDTVTIIRVLHGAQDWP
jgi:toxin ParE1/3/4